MPFAILGSGGPESSPRERETESQSVCGATTRLRYKLPAGNELCPCTSRCFFGGIARRAVPCRTYVEPLRMLPRRNGSRAPRWYYTSLDTNSRSPRSLSLSLSLLLSFSLYVHERALLLGIKLTPRRCRREESRDDFQATAQPDD